MGLRIITIYFDRLCVLAMALGELVENEPLIFLTFFFSSLIILTIGMWYGDKIDGSSKRK